MDDRTRRRHACEIFDAGVRSATPPRVLVAPSPVALDRLRRVVIVGAGKAAALLLPGALRWLRDSGVADDVPRSGLVLVPEGAVPLRSKERAVEILAVRARDANAPTDAAAAATQRILATAHGLGPDDLLVCLLTGGGSALLTAPAPGVNAAEKAEAVRLLAADGATIAEINTLRRHLSAVKGGRLAQAASGARAIVSFLVSDVDDDIPHAIASGPTVPDPTTFRDALDLRDEWPPGVLGHLERGRDGEVSASPTALAASVSWHIVASPDDALRGATEHARALGWRPQVLARPTQRRVDGCVAEHLDAVRRAAPGAAIVSVGEAPPELPPFPPPGGRAGHLALALGVAVDADPRLRGRTTVLVGATDHEDGTSGTAGGVVDADVLRRAEAASIDPARLLERCDALRVLRAGGGTLAAAATVTNVQDLRVILVGAPAAPATRGTEETAR